MVLYRYHAHTQEGEDHEGVFEAPDLRAAMRHLADQGLQVLSLAKVPPESAGWGKKVDATELSQVSRKLASLTEMGAPLAHSLTMITAEIRNAKLRETLRDIREQLEAGHPLSETLSRFPELFSSFHIGMIAAGEQSGTLSHMLYRLSDIWQKQAHFRSRLRALLIYPMCIFFVIFCFAVLFEFFLFPRMLQIYPEQTELPAYAIFQTLLRAAIYATPIILVVLLLLWRYSKRSHAMRLFVARLLLAMPITGVLVRELNAARFARTFGMLLRGGVEPTEALRLSAKVVGNPVAEREFEAAADLVGVGRPISDALEATNVVPADLILALSLSEDRGTLSQDLLEMADNHEKSVDLRITGLLSVLEPAVLLILALFVGLCALSGWLPYIHLVPAAGPAGGIF